MRPSTTPPTEPVSARVTPALKQWLAEEAAQHQMAPSTYTGRVLARAAICFDELDQLRDESREKVRLLEQMEERLHQQRDQFSWYEGAIREQLDHVLYNHQVLEWLYEQYSTLPIPISEALEVGFQPGYLLNTHRFEGEFYFGLGEYSWRFRDKTETHLLILYHAR